MKRISELQHPYRLFLTLLWRISAACFLFLTYSNMKIYCLRAMKNNPYIRNVSGFWNAEMLCRAVFYLSLLMYFSLACIFALHDAPYRRRALGGGLGSFTARAKAVLIGYEFWIEAAVLSLWVLFSASDVYFFDFVAGFYTDLDLSRAHWLTVGIMIPLLFVITFLAHLATVGWWARKEQPSNVTVRRRIRAFGKQLVFTCVMYLLMAFTLTPLYPMMATFGKVVNIHPLLFVIPFGIVLIALLSYRYLRALLARYRFVRGLTRICHSERYKLTDRAHLYASVFSPKEGISFRFTTEEGEYTCKLICSLRRKTPLFFDEEGKVSYDVSLGLFGLDFFTDTVSARYDFEAKDKKLLILSPAVDRVYITDGKARRLLDSGDRFMGYTLYTGETFLNALRRKGL
ncbi:MAG: hypothetical protein J6W14_05455 [Clostridia bacterium]|nr:hypothetical protein [Clostridia bacterium]